MPENMFPGPKLYPLMHLPSLQAKENKFIRSIFRDVSLIKQLQHPLVNWFGIVNTHDIFTKSLGIELSDDDKRYLTYIEPQAA